MTSTREASDQSSPTTHTPERLRSQQQEEEEDIAPPLEYVHLKDTILPPSILALSHITKELNLLLMTPDEAAVEAAATGDTEWMIYLLARFKYFDNEETVAETAAVHGHLQMVKMVAFHFYDYVGKFHQDMSENVTKMAAMAARWGHLDAVNFLLPEKVNVEIKDEVIYGTYNLSTNAQKVVVEAAAHGHLEVVKAIVARSFVNDNFETDGPDALSVSIVENHMEIAVFLLGVKKCKWELVEACDLALATHHEELIEMIEKAYEPPRVDCTFFVQVAKSGNVATVKYLYENGYSDEVSVSLGFEAAAVHERTEVVEFLHGTGRISSSVFDRAVDARVKTLSVDESTTLVFLFKTKRAPSATINQVFKAAARANNVGLVKFLHENEDIADASIIEAVQNSAAYCDKTAQMVKFLYALPCISSDIIADVFLTAIRNRNRDVLMVLRCDTRLSADAFEKGFIEATVQGCLAELHLLYEEDRVSNGVMLEAFTKAAASARNVPIVNQLATYVSVGCSMPEDMQFQVFVIAARNGQKKALDILTKNRGADWPLSMLKEALDSARDPEVKNCVGQLIRDQIFSGSPQEVAASDKFGHDTQGLTRNANK